MLIRDQTGTLHALAWRDGQLIDCRADNPTHQRIEDVTVLACAIFTDAPFVRVEQQKEAA